MWTALNPFAAPPYAYPFCFWPPFLPSDPLPAPPLSVLPLSLKDLETRSSLNAADRRESGAEVRLLGPAGGVRRKRCARKEKLTKKRVRMS